MTYPPQPGPPHSSQPGGYPASPTSWGAPGSPPPNRRTGWIIGGSIAVLVVVLGVAATLYATGEFGSGTASIAEPEASQEAEPTDSAAQTGDYQYNDSLCSEVDWKPFFELTNINPRDVFSEYTEDIPGKFMMHCEGIGSAEVDGDGVGTAIWATAQTHDSADMAIDHHQALTIEDDAEAENASGDWEQGTWQITEASDANPLYVDLDAQAGNLTITLNLSVAEPDAHSEAKAAAQTVAEEIMAILSRE